MRKTKHVDLIFLSFFISSISNESSYAIIPTSLSCKTTVGHKSMTKRKKNKMLRGEMPLSTPLEHATTNLKLFFVRYDTVRGKIRRGKFLGVVIPEMFACFTAK